MDTPDFISTTQDQILQAFIADYEAGYLALTGNAITLNPAQAEQLLINSGAYMGYLQALKIQGAALMNLPQFATYPALDCICQPFGVTRLPAQPSQTTLLLTLVAGHGALVIPAGVRIQSQDGLVNFVLQSAVTVAADVNTITAVAVCDTAGSAANGYVSGQISNILDPQAYLVSAVNTDTTNAGADVETDANLRTRLFLAPSAFSIAGTDDAYKFWAKTASPLITDVGVDNSGGGVVNIYPLVPGGATSQEILTAVYNACSPKNRRPTSDTVNAISPTIINYSIEIDLTLYASVTDPEGLTAQVLASVQALALANGQGLNLDILRSDITVAAKPSGVYNPVINSPANDIVVGKNEVAVCTGVVVNLVGFNNEK